MPRCRESQRNAAPGTVIETSPAAAAVVSEIAARLAAQGGAALFIDYGHADGRSGSSVQAVRGQRQVDWLAEPGLADLSAHVDFRSAADVAQASGARWLGTAEQGAWLRALGIDQRTAALAKAAPDQREALLAARERLVAPEQMGALFKVMGLAGKGWPDGAGF